MAYGLKTEYRLRMRAMQCCTQPGAAPTPVSQPKPVCTWLPCDCGGAASPTPTSMAVYGDAARDLIAAAMDALV
ncbi:hypothetical protein GA0115234_100435 [Streptomyces sp. DvalAA-43]|nr:hypothetical protein GA0115234_100435 [Streptomyces sp. DvalAA-43]